MKKLHVVLISVGATLLAVLCVALGVLWRDSYCRITYICEEGCEHIAWQKKGESANLEVVYEAHADLVAEKKEPLGIFIDEARLLYYFEETLHENSKTYYLGKWHRTGFWFSQGLCFNTPHGDIVIFMNRSDSSQNAEKRETYYNELKERFYQAYEALGGSRDDILYYTFRYHSSKIWNTYTPEISGVDSLYRIFYNFGLSFYAQGAGAQPPRYYYPMEKILVTDEPLNGWIPPNERNP